MNELLSDAKAIVTGLLALLVALLAWVSKRLHDRVDNHIDKDHPQRDAGFLPRAEFDKALIQLNADRKEKHETNVETLRRIEQKIDQGEARDSTTRHEIRDRVNAVSTEVAVLTALFKKSEDDKKSETE